MLTSWPYLSQVLLNIAHQKVFHKHYRVFFTKTSVINFELDLVLVFYRTYKIIHPPNAHQAIKALARAMGLSGVICDKDQASVYYSRFICASSATHSRVEGDGD